MPSKEFIKFKSQENLNESSNLKIRFQPVNENYVSPKKEESSNNYNNRVFNLNVASKSGYKPDDFPYPISIHEGVFSGIGRSIHDDAEEDHN